MDVGRSACGSIAALTEDRREVEEALPGYEIGDELGRGAFGVVYEGRHRSLERRVAIKQLPRALSADPSLQARFLSEARVVASLDHPHIVPVYDYVERGGLRLIVMEHLGGGTLGARMTEAAMRPEAACAVVLAIAGALQHAHAKGVLHRDIKPDNVLFTGEGGRTPKLADFGIAKVLQAESTMTVTGTVIGTVAYMSPEQASGAEIGPPSDVYTCGILLYQLLAGRFPFPPVSSFTGQLLQHITTPPTPLREVAPAIAPGVADVVMRSLEKDPKVRYGSAGAFGAALRAAAEGAFGPVWLNRSGLDIVGSERLVQDMGSLGTVVQPAAQDLPEREHTAGVARAAITAIGATPPSTKPPHPPRRRPGWVIAVVAGVAVALIAGLVAALAGGGSPDAAAPTTAASPATVGPSITSVPATLAPATLAPTLAPATTLAPTTAPTTTLAPTTAPAATAAPVTVTVTVLVTTPPTPAPTAPPTPAPTPAPTTVASVRAREAALATLGVRCSAAGGSGSECACLAGATRNFTLPEINQLALSLSNNARMPARVRSAVAACLDPTRPTRGTVKGSRS